MHEQIQRVQAKVPKQPSQVNLLMSYESKLQALSEQVAIVHNQLKTPSGSLQKQLQQSNVLKNKLTLIETNLIDGFNKLQNNVQNSLQELNSKVATMEDGILSILHEKQAQISKISRRQSQLIRTVDTLQQTIVQLSRNDRTSANQSLSSLLTLKIDKHINETTAKLSDLQAMIHQNDTKSRNSLKQLSSNIDSRLNSPQMNHSSELSRFDNMIQSMSEQITQLSRKVATNQKNNNSLKQKISSVQKESTDSMNSITDRLQGILKQMVNMKTFLLKDIDSVRNQVKNQPKTEIQSKSRNASSGEVTPQQPTISNFQQYAVGVRGLRQQRDKKQQLSSSKPKLQPPRQLSSMFNPPKPARQDLPPVQDDPRFSQKKQTNTQSKKKNQILVQSDSQLEQQFYVNQQGYIVNADGNLVLDKWGQPILYPSDAQDA